YKGLNVHENIAVSKDDASGNAQTIDAVTSATISSRAVTKAVNDAVTIYNENVGSDASISATGSADDGKIITKEGE
ncbi:MAG: FMN-binding protein, partial [Ruminococcus sp.]|nr:FMN-binding protein [Ruminococcus sp.]